MTKDTSTSPAQRHRICLLQTRNITYSCFDSALPVIHHRALISRARQPSSHYCSQNRTMTAWALLPSASCFYSTVSGQKSVMFWRFDAWEKYVRIMWARWLICGLCESSIMSVQEICSVNKVSPKNCISHAAATVSDSSCSSCEL